MTNIRNALMQAAGSSGGDKVYVEDVFSTYLLNGTEAESGSSVTGIVNGVDLDDKGGLVWIKRRDATADHRLFDTVNVPNKFLESNTTDALFTNSYWSTTNVNGFNSNGFDFIGENTSGIKFASWTFAKQPGFFDVVTYTGTGSSKTVSHNLGCVPGMIIVKMTTTAGYKWRVWHKSLGNNMALCLNDNSAESDDGGGGGGWWNNTPPTSSVFSVGTYGQVNNNGDTFVAYLFADGDNSDAQIFGDNSDEQIIKCGTYNGNSTIPYTVDLGFEPQWLLIKRTDSGSADDWMIVDNMRGQAIDDLHILEPNNSDAENATSFNCFPAANGFTINTNVGQFNGNGAPYIYVAIRRGPMKEPSAGTDVLGLDASSASSYESPFFQGNNVVDHAFWRTSTGGTNYVNPRLLSQQFMQAQAKSAAGNNQDALFDFMNGFYDLGSGTAPGYYASMFTRYPKVFDVAVYIGTGSNTTHAHNLGVVPEMMIIKQTDNADYGWFVYESNGGKDKYMYLDGVDQQNTSSNIFGSTPTATNIVANPTNNYINASGVPHLALLFASLTGISKVGTYTGTGSDLNVTGLGAAVRWVMIKRTDSSGDWYVFDTLRGIVAGNDDYFLMNTTGADVTNTDYIDPHSSGFTVTSNASSTINVSGGTYVYLAFA
tara:strand:+ start:5060 stop:7024 length:1965 start_codon:yes stop_codon:yes gene_type:complete